MTIYHSRKLGNTGITVPSICFGTSALGNMPDTYGYSVDEARALETIRAIFASPYGFSMRLVFMDLAVAKSGSAR